MPGLVLAFGFVSSLLCLCVMGVELEIKEGEHASCVCDTRGEIHPEAKVFSTYELVKPDSLCAPKCKGSHL